MVGAVAHYLERHAEPEAALARLLDGRWPAVVVLPACGEAERCLDGVTTVGPALVIVVVNGREDHAPEVHARNQALLAAHAGAALAPGASLGRRRECDVLLVDRASAGRRLPPRQGVGLARKIGCDVALALWRRGLVASRFIHWADADAVLPPGHFEGGARAPSGAMVLTHPFEHVPCGDPALDEAHAVYESFLRYHRLGLAAAGSPYAHHCVGSTLAIDAVAYAVTRGVPRRQAGEDFYMVDKCAKLGDVHVPSTAPVRIRARHSARVPFGTGRGAADILALGRERDYLMDAPHAFALLGAWLIALDAAVQSRHVDAARSSLARLPAADQDALLSALHAMNAFDGLRAAVSEGDARKRVRDWFDGFRTMRLLHLLREHGVPRLLWRDALAGAPFLSGIDATADSETIRRALAVRDEAR